MLAYSSAVGLMFYLESEEAWAFVLVTALGMWLLFENDRAKVPKALERTSDDERRSNELNLPL